MTIKRKLILTLFIACFTFINLKAQTADEIIAKHFEARGGIDIFKNLKSRIIKTKFILPQGEAFITILQTASDKMKTTIETGGQEIVEAYDGTNAWTINPFRGVTSAQKMSGEAEKIMINRSIFESPLINYKDKGHEVALEGTEMIKDKKCFKIKFTNKNQKVEHYFFDAETYLMSMKRDKNGDSYYSDFKKVDSMLLPYKVTLMVDGQMRQEMQVQEIELNTEIADAEFAYPE